MTTTHWPARTEAPGCAHFAHDAGLWRIHGDFHFHRFQDDEFLASLYLLTDLYPHLPQVAGDIAFHAVAAFGQRRFGLGAPAAVSSLSKCACPVSIQRWRSASKAAAWCD